MPISMVLPSKKSWRPLVDPIVNEPIIWSGAAINLIVDIYLIELSASIFVENISKSGGIAKGFI
jgi:hypothetical protein